MISPSTDIIHHPIGVIHTPHTRAEETPIQPVYARGIPGTVEVFADYEEGLRDVEGFSYVYLVYSLDRAGAPKLTVTPYMEDVERGVFRPSVAVGGADGLSDELFFMVELI